MAPENELPQYHQSLSPTLLCLDGGATRVITEIYLLSEIMHRLHWDLNLFRPTTSPSCSTKPPTPSDSFDYIGCGGTSTLVAFLLACGYSAEETRDRFIQLAPLLTDPHVNLGLELETLVPRHVSMGFEGNLIVDFPARCAVWVDTPHLEDTKSCGVLIRRGEPIIAKLIPLVVSEIKRELKGQTTTLNHTLPFLQAICPVFDDCSVLLSLGSGDVPISPPRSSTPPPRSYSPIQFLPNPLSWWSTSTSTPEHTQPITLPALPPCRPTLQDIRTLSKYIPTYAYGTSYIRLQPSLTTWTINGEQGSPKDWEAEKFGEHKMLVSGFVGRCENARSMDVVVEFLKRRDFEGGSIRDETNDIQRLVYESARYY